jgi:drug/metabolite transporter (DMT)-like permease
MLTLVAWVIVYAIVVAASIIFIGKPSLVEGSLQFKTFAKLLIDWRFLLGGALALGARFIFVIINNLAARHPSLSEAHLTVAALATTGSIITIILANFIFLHEHLRPIQLVGTVLILGGVFLAFK